MPRRSRGAPGAPPLAWAPRPGRLRGPRVSVGVVALIAFAAWLGACRPAAGPPPAAPLPADVAGVLTYQREGNVWTLPLDTKAERKLTDFPPASQAVYSARSADGTRLAVVRVEGFGSTLAVSNAAGGDERTVIDEGGGYTTLERPQWTPDGKAIVYTYHSFVVEAGSIKGETIRGERVDVESGERTPLAPDAEGPTMAPDGSLSFVRTGRGGQQLALLDPTGAEKVLIAERSFVSVAAPRFSPDGQRIAFTAVGAGPAVGQQPAAPRGPSGGLAALVERLGAALGPRTAYAHGEPAAIWVAELSGAVRRVGQLTEDEPTLAWSTDGRLLGVSGGTGVHVLDVSSGQANQLVKLGGFGGIDWTR